MPFGRRRGIPLAQSVLVLEVIDSICAEIRFCSMLFSRIDCISLSVLNSHYSTTIENMPKAVSLCETCGADGFLLKNLD